MIYGSKKQKGSFVKKDLPLVKLFDLKEKKIIECKMEHKHVLLSKEDVVLYDEKEHKMKKTRAKKVESETGEE